MGEPTNNRGRATSTRPLLLLHVLLLFLLLPAPTVAFDLGSLLSLLGGGGSSGNSKPTACPQQCNCTTPSAEKVMQSYVTRYLPFMGVHMKSKLEAEARGTISLMTAWLGSMADVRCHLAEGEAAYLSEFIQASALSFRSVSVTCEPNATLLWDVSPLSPFLNILDITGCALNKPAEPEPLANKTGEAETPAKMGEAEMPAKMGEAEMPAKMGEAEMPAKMGETDTPAKMGEFATPAKMGEFATPAKMGEFATPAKMGEFAAPARMGEFAMPAKVGEAETPAKTGEAETPANKLADDETLAVPFNLWVLHMDGVKAEDVQRLDLTTAPQLLALSFTRCNLTKLPQRWANANLLRLMYFGLANNNLNRFSCAPKTPIAMTSLNLDLNDLTALPSCLLDGSQYAYHVSLRHNRLHSLRQLFVNKSDSEGSPFPVPFVEHLDVSHNKLTSLRALKKIHLLQGLDVSYNRLASVSVDTFNLNPTIQWLDLSNNMLEQVPDGSLSSLMVVRHLNLSHNHISAFDFDQSPLSTKLVTLDLRYNHLTYPPFADTGYVVPRRSLISAAHNPFTCDCNMQNFLQFMDVVNSTKHNWFGLGYWDPFKGNPSMNQPYVDTSELMCNQPPDMHGLPISTLSFNHACPMLQGCPVGCKCQLIKGSDQHLLVDCSHDKNLLEMPHHLPVLSDIPLVLDLTNTSVKRLDHRPYLRKVKKLLAGHGKIASVSPGAMLALENVTVLELHDNQLRSLPPVTQNLTLAAATNISLAGNPWTCGCHDLWMPDWLAKHAAALNDSENVTCRWTGNAVTTLSPDDLNCGLFNYLPLVIALSMLLGAAAVLASLLVKYRLEVLVFLYTRFRVRPFDLYKYDRHQPYLYDVFVSFSQHDYRWVLEKLVDQLENRKKPYRLCIHLRDFPVGAPIADSVAWAVDNSRCTLLVLTRDFLASEWCRHEFRAAHARLLKDPNAKLLIVVHGPLDARILDRELLAYLRTHTYLRTEDKWFWSKLEYALPKPQEPVVLLGAAGAGGAADAGAGGGAGAIGGIVGGLRREMAAAEEIGLDTFLPAAMAAGDVSPKLNGHAPPAVTVAV